MTLRAARIRADAVMRQGRRNGQAMIETVVVMFFLCIVFFLVYEYANLLNARTVVDYAATRAARARAVGFNDFMVTKTVRVATAGVAGECRSQTDEGDDLSTDAIVSRMGSYLETEYEADAKGILDFELWDFDKLGWSADEPKDNNAELHLRVWQRRPLYGFSDDPDQDHDLRTVTGEASIENHYPFYMK